VKPLLELVFSSVLYQAAVLACIEQFGYLYCRVGWDSRQQGDGHAALITLRLLAEGAEGSVELVLGSFEIDKETEGKRSGVVLAFTQSPIPCHRGDA
jgi:hypothetical protein